MGGHRPPAWRLCVLAALGTSLVHGAETSEPEPIRAALSAPAECPGSGEFLRQVLARTGRARAALASEPARTFNLEIESRPAGFAGKLRVLTPRREWVERRVDADRCEEVVEALALVAALILDPEAVTDRRSEAQRDEPPWTRVPSAPRGPEPLPLSPATPPPCPTPLGVRVGIGGELVGGIAETVMPAGRIWGELVGRGRGAFHPVVGLGLLVGRAEVGGSYGGTGAITALTERLTVCPLALRSPVLSLSPCALGDLGMILSTSGDATSWTALGFGLRLDLEVPRPFIFRLEGGVEWQPAKTTFSFDLAPGRDDARTTPPWGGFVGLGAGVQL